MVKHKNIKIITVLSRQKESELEKPKLVELRFRTTFKN
jgi:hypothetical protein